MNWKGEILLESLQDPSVMNTLQVDSVEELKDEDGLWHVYHVTLDEAAISTIGKCLKDGPWFIHFLRESEIIVVFKDELFKFKENDVEALEKVKEYAQKLHIPEEELQLGHSL